MKRTNNQQSCWQLIFESIGHVYLDIYTCIEIRKKAKVSRGQKYFNIALVLQDE